MTRQSFFRCLSAVATLLALGATIGYLWHAGTVSLGDLRFDPTRAFCASATIVIYLGLTALAFGESLRLAGYPLSVREKLSLSLVGNALNQVGSLVVGHSVRAAYLKKFKTIPFSRYFSAQLVTLFISGISTGVIGCAAFFILAMTRDGLRDPAAALALVCGFLALTIAASIFATKPIVSLAKLLPKSISTILENFAEGIPSLNRLGPLAITSFFQVCSHHLAIWLAGSAAGLKVDCIVTLAVNAIGMFVSFVSFTPGALGLYELATGLAAKAARTDVSTQVAGIVAFRSLFLLLSLIGGAVGLALSATPKTRNSPTLNGTPQ